MVTSQYAKAPGVDRETLVKPELGAKVGHKAIFRIQCLQHFGAGLGFKISVVSGQYSPVFGEKGAVFRCLIEPGLGHPSQEQFRVVLHFLPETEINPREQAAHAMIPAVEQVIGQRIKSFQCFW